MQPPCIPQVMIIAPWLKNQSLQRPWTRMNSYLDHLLTVWRMKYDGRYAAIPRRSQHPRRLLRS